MELSECVGGLVELMEVVGVVSVEVVLLPVHCVLSQVRRTLRKRLQKLLPHQRLVEVVLRLQQPQKHHLPLFFYYTLLV